MSVKTADQQKPAQSPAIEEEAIALLASLAGKCPQRWSDSWSEGDFEELHPEALAFVRAASPSVVLAILNRLSDAEQKAGYVSAGKFLGLVGHCKFSDKRLAELTSQLNTVRLYEQKEVWYWQGDGEDHLESLVCPVVINAEDLRELLRSAVAAVLPAAQSAPVKLEVEPARKQLGDERTIARLAAEKAPKGATHCGPADKQLSPIFLRKVDGLITDVWTAGRGWKLTSHHYTFTADDQPSIYHELLPLPCDGNHGGPRCADPECWIDDVVDAAFDAPVEAVQVLRDDKGLPPIGTFCEVVDEDGSLVYGHGESGRVVAHVEDCAVVRMSYGLGCFTASYLRLVRTPEQIAAVERVKAVSAMWAALNARLPERYRTFDGEALRCALGILHDQGFCKTVAQ